MPPSHWPYFLPFSSPIHPFCSFPLSPSPPSVLSATFYLPSPSSIFLCPAKPPFSPSSSVSPSLWVTWVGRDAVMQSTAGPGQPVISSCQREAESTRNLGGMRGGGGGSTGGGATGRPALCLEQLECIWKLQKLKLLCVCIPAGISDFPCQQYYISIKMSKESWTVLVLSHVRLRWNCTWTDLCGKKGACLHYY